MKFPFLKNFSVFIVSCRTTIIIDCECTEIMFRIDGVGLLAGIVLLLNYYYVLVVVVRLNERRLNRFDQQKMGTNHLLPNRFREQQLQDAYVTIFICIVTNSSVIWMKRDKQCLPWDRAVGMCVCV